MPPELPNPAALPALEQSLDVGRPTNILTLSQSDVRGGGTLVLESPGYGVRWLVSEGRNNVKAVAQSVNTGPFSRAMVYVSAQCNVNATAVIEWDAGLWPGLRDDPLEGWRQGIAALPNAAADTPQRLARAVFYPGVRPSQLQGGPRAIAYSGGLQAAKLPDTTAIGQQVLGFPTEQHSRVELVSSVAVNWYVAELGVGAVSTWVRVTPSGFGTDGLNCPPWCAVVATNTTGVDAILTLRWT